MAWINLWLIACSAVKIMQHASLHYAGSTIILVLSCVIFTGCVWNTGYSLKLFFWPTRPWMEWLLSIWRTCWLHNTHAPVRSLRSQNDNLLLTPRYRLDGYGKRSFAVAAPFLWNSLPINIKKSPSLDIFKRRLKTHLFINDYFNWWTLDYHVHVYSYCFLCDIVYF